MKIFDSTLGNLEAALDIRLQRQTVLSGNIANADTPGFAPLDIDFDAAMRSVAQTRAGEAPSSIALAAPTSGPGIGTSGAAANPDLQPVPGKGGAPGLDGNSVDLDQTLVEIASNGLQYTAAARTAGKKLALLRYAASDGQG